MQERNAPSETNFWSNIFVGFLQNQEFSSRINVGEALVELFLAEKVADFTSETSKICRFCGEKLKLIRTMVNSRTGGIVHMFECRCGLRTWEE